MIFKRKQKQHVFTPDERQRMEQYLELKTSQNEVIGLLDQYSGNFDDWTIIINEAVNEAIARKRQLNMDCEKEQKMLDDLSSLFTKLASFSEMLAEWHKELTFRIENTEKMIE